MTLQRRQVDFSSNVMLLQSYSIRSWSGPSGLWPQAPGSRAKANRFWGGSVGCFATWERQDTATELWRREL